MKSRLGKRLHQPDKGRVGAVEDQCPKQKKNNFDTASVVDRGGATVLTRDSDAINKPGRIRHRAASVPALYPRGRLARASEQAIARTRRISLNKFD